MMFCKYCGKEIVDNSVFCKYCGAKLKSPKNNIPKENQENIHIEEKIKISGVDNSKQEETKFGNSYKTNLMIGYIGIIAVFLVILCFNLPNNDNTLKHKGNANTSNKELSDKTNTSTKQTEESIDAKSPEYYYETLMKPLDLRFKQKLDTTKNNDLLFHTFKQDYADVVEKLNQNEVKIPKGSNSNYWVKMLQSEGMEYYASNYIYLKKQYGKYLSQTYNSWLSYLDKTQEVVDDAGLLIKPDKLRVYIIELENLIANNSDFVEINSMKDDLKWYLDIYTQGMPNTPIYDYETNKIDEDFKASYEKFLDENKDSKYYPFMQELYQKLQELDFTYNEDFREWNLKLYEKYVK